MCTTLLRTCM